jgi:hypothetical protein
LHADRPLHRRVRHCVTVSSFLEYTVKWFAMQKVKVERAMTDNSSAFAAVPFARSCVALHVLHKRTRLSTRRTNKKADRFIQTLLRE